MPSIELKISQLEELLGKKLDFEQLQYDLQWISLDIDDFNSEEQTIKVEFNPNRPDFSSPEGIARVLRGYYDIEVGLPQFELKKGEEVFHVDAKVRKVRPYVVSGVVKFSESLNETQVITLMHMQEILHWAVGRDRKKVAIGIHDWETVKGPYRYTTVKPDGVKFKPLHLEAYELTPAEILEEHPMGIQYTHLLDGFDEYPIIYDAEGKVVSLPPIINGTYTTVTPDKTKILLLDLTGTDLLAVEKSLNILATTFADMGGQVETVQVIYEDEPEKARNTPDLTPSTWKVHVDYIESYLGLGLTGKDMVKYLSKVRLDATLTKDPNILSVQVPAYRADFMHEVDFVEEVAMGYGYQNLPLTVNEGGFGKYHPLQELAQRAREIMIGAGALEMMNNILASRTDFLNLRQEFKEKEHILIANPVSIENNTVRTMLLVGLMRNLQNNRSAEKPFRLFEVGDIIHLDSTQDTGARRELHLVCVVHSESSDFSEIKSVLDFYCRTQGVFGEIEVRPTVHKTFIEGRTGEIFYRNQSIGFVGEIYPQVVINFGLEYPTAAFEVNLELFLD